MKINVRIRNRYKYKHCTANSTCLNIMLKLGPDININIVLHTQHENIILELEPDININIVLHTQHENIMLELEPDININIVLYIVQAYRLTQIPMKKTKWFNKLLSVPLKNQMSSNPLTATCKNRN